MAEGSRRTGKVAAALARGAAEVADGSQRGTLRDMTEPQIIGADLAARYPDRYRDAVPPTPRPCPICSHPLGACTGDEHLGTIDATPTGAAVIEDDLVVLKQDVYETVYLRNTKRPMRKLKWKKGDTVPKREVDEHNRVFAVQEEPLMGGIEVK